jgi:hypothetical protein
VNPNSHDLTISMYQNRETHFIIFKNSCPCHMIATELGVNPPKLATKAIPHPLGTEKHTSICHSYQSINCT